MFQFIFSAKRTGPENNYSKEAIFSVDATMAAPYLNYDSGVRVFTATVESNVAVARLLTPWNVEREAASGHHHPTQSTS